jgi:hypothetical protein
MELIVLVNGIPEVAEEQELPVRLAQVQAA